MTAIIQIALMRVALCGLAASFVLFALRSRVARTSAARLLSAWRDLTALGRVAVCSFLLVGILVGGDKTNSVPPNLNSPLPQMMQDGGSFQAGFTGLAGMGNLVNLVNPVQTGHSVQQSFAQRKATNWNVRGAWKDSFWLDFEDGWVFPWGTNHLSGVEVVSFGQVWPTPFDTNAVAAAGAPFEIVRGLTTFAYEFTPSNSYRFVWTDAAINRDTNNLITASIELFRNGDVAVTTNGVTRTIPRELPFVHDGFGQDAEWVAANFTNATEIAAAGGYPAWVDAQVGEGLTNGLYKLTVGVADDPPETVNLVVGDLSVAITNAGAYVFLLEKGTRYTLGLSACPDGFAFDCDDGLGIAVPRLLRGPVNSPAYSVLLTAYVDPGEVELVEPRPEGDGSVIWHPWLLLAPDRLVDPTFPLLLSAGVFDLPQGAYPTVEWQAGGATIATGENILWSGDEDVDFLEVVAMCRDSTLYGHYEIARHVKTSEIALTGGGLIVVEDAYTNAPGEVVAASSTSVGLELSWSLAEDGTLTLSSNCAAFVLTNEYGTIFTLPHSWHGFVDEEDEWRLFASCTNLSQTGHVGNFVFTFTPDSQTAETITRTVGVDVVKIRVEAETDWPSNKVRHVFGPQELFTIVQTPQIPKLSYSAEEGSTAYVNNGSCLAPNDPVPFNIRFAASGCAGRLSFECIAPTGLQGGSPRALTTDEWGAVERSPLQIGDVGVVVHIDTWLTPLHVSFANVRLYEGECNPTNRAGCFLDADRFTDDMLAHNVAAGASVGPSSDYVNIQSEGNRTQNGDTAGLLLYEESNLSNGSFQLNIPLWWYVHNGTSTNALPDNVQTIWIYTNGTMRVNKNGVTWERSQDGSEHQVEE